MNIIGSLAVLAIVIVVFLLCRAFVLWYFNLDKIAEYLRSIEETNKQILEEQKYQSDKIESFIAGSDAECSEEAKCE